jgi:2-keto-4-pentenoate hydratase/2-oxohepta-3-ene-1,7-dioic acid hydratase in catechol pathway
VGQDISERISQLRGPAAQFGLGKSFPGFSPQGPWLVTLDELRDVDDLELGCTLDGEEVQKGRTRDLIFSVPKLIATLSHTVTLYPGDVLFTGTPAGVGVGRQPPRFVQPGERLDSWIEGIGELHQVFEADTTTP